jgi:cytoskeletal protein RodZ
MNESIGAKLKQARELRRLTLQQVSETTKVRPHYLQALENDDLSAISSVAQARGFLRIYAEFLGLTPADLVPVAPPAEPVPATQLSVSSPENSVPNPQRVADIDKPSRPGLLTNLLNRFIHLADRDTVSSQNTETELAAAGSNIPENQSFSPARVTEELPDDASPVIPAQTAEKKTEPTEQSPIKDVPKSRRAKKIPSKTRKYSAHVDEQGDVKKKAGG